MSEDPNCAACNATLYDDPLVCTACDELARLNARKDERAEIVAKLREKADECERIAAAYERGSPAWVCEVTDAACIRQQAKWIEGGCK